MYLTHKNRAIEGYCNQKFLNLETELTYFLQSYPFKYVN